jgi:hypothetical protein
MKKLKIFCRKNEARNLIATVYIQAKQVIVEAVDVKIKQEISEIIEKAIKEGRVIKRIVKSPAILRYFGAIPPEELSEELAKKLKEAYQEIPLKPEDPEFLECLTDYRIWAFYRPGGGYIRTEIVQE